MTGKINIYTEEWCDLVFEGKNKEYGAYVDRKKSSKRHAVALLISVVLFTLGVSAPVILKALAPKKKIQNTEITRLVDVKIDKPKEKQIEEAPPPPPVKTTIKFTPPEVKPDEEVTEELKTMDEIKENKTAISIADVQGSDDANAVDVADLKVKEVVQEKEEIFQQVEQMPDFPGGTEALSKFLSDNLKYPPTASEMGIQGRVYVKFVVNKRGEISNVTVLRGIGGGCDEEAIRVVKKMPAWKPGKQNGQPVMVYFTLPVLFKLSE
ncbi:MAG: TonB family protein [Bacteroidota bacterium]|nr:TonB family protein [Bacteroidota bacterium]